LDQRVGPEFRRLSETIALEMTRKWIEITTAGGEEEAAEAAKAAAEEKANNVNAQLNGGLSGGLGGLGGPVPGSVPPGGVGYIGGFGGLGFGDLNDAAVPAPLMPGPAPMPAPAASPQRGFSRTRGRRRFQSIGRLRPGLPDHIEIVTKRALNGVAQRHIIARAAPERAQDGRRCAGREGATPHPCSQDRGRSRWQRS
jgi:hypothetical protein